MRRWGIDMAYGIPFKDSGFQELIANGLSFIIYRSGQRWDIQDDVTRQVAIAEKYNIPYAFYHWMEPGLSVVRQAEAMLAFTLKYHPKFLAPDFEQRESTYGRGDCMTSAEISKTYRAIASHLRSRTSLPIVLYTGYWFVEEYAAHMKDWMGEYLFWNASYRKFAPQTWDEFNILLPKLSHPGYTGYPDVNIWQFAGNLYLPNTNHMVDVNLIDDDVLFTHLFAGGTAPRRPGDKKVEVIEGQAPVEVKTAENTPAEHAKEVTSGQTQVEEIPKDVILPTGQHFKVKNTISFLSINRGPGPRDTYGTTGHYLTPEDSGVEILEFKGTWGRVRHEFVEGWVNTSPRYMERMS